MSQMSSGLTFAKMGGRVGKIARKAGQMNKLHLRGRLRLKVWELWPQGLVGLGSVW